MYYVALDQGTTSSRAVLYDESGTQLAIASQPLSVRFPEDGWVEQDPNEIWSTQLAALKELCADIPSEEIAAIGITNQRETVIVWDRNTGEPLAPAIVWQCRRSSEICARLRTQGYSEIVQKRTGLVLNPYFSASKILWLLENQDGLREKVEQGSAVFGTVDSWLIYQLTGANKDAIIATEPSNASRTMLFSIESALWDPELLSIFGVSEANLPTVRPSCGRFGVTEILGAQIPITGVLGDQQASLLGHGGVVENSIKCTFGTGAFLLLNTADKRRQSESGLLTTIAWQESERLSYAIEGSIFMAGALVQWLRDKLELVSSAAETEQLAGSVEHSAGVLLVPAFVGLGAPYWDDEARGAVFGLTREAGRAHIVRAALEGVAHQVADITESSEFKSVKSMRIDGGMSVNSVFVQILADFTGLSIEVAPTAEVTALGAARAAFVGLGQEQGTGGCDSLASAADSFGVSSEGSAVLVKPTLDAGTRDSLRAAWKDAISRVRSS